MGGAPTSGEDPQQDVGWSTLAPILIVHLCGTLGFSLGLPILVFLVADLGGAAWTYGLLGATYSVAQTIGAPVLGRWSDRVGRRTILVVSQAGTVLAWALFLVALQLPREALGSVGGTAITLPLLVIFVARFLDGLTGGNISVANAYVADVTRGLEGARQIAFGRMGMATSLGFTAGPALAGVLALDGDPYTLPLAAAGAVSLVGVFLILRLEEPDGRCPEGPPPQVAVARTLAQQQKRCDSAPAERLGRSLTREPRIRAALAATFVMFLGFNLYYAAFPVHATQRIGWSPAQMGLFFSLMSGAMFVTQGPLLQALTKVASPRAVFSLGLVGLVLAFMAYPGVTTAAAYAGGLLFALGNGFAWPTFQARTANLAPDADQGALQGAISSAGSFASIAGLIVGGALYPWLGGDLFWISAALFALVYLAVPRLFGRE